MPGAQKLRSSAGCALRLDISRSAAMKLPTPFTTTAAFAAAAAAAAPFSTTARMCKRKTKDNNPKRGVSSLYRSGPREPLSVSNMPLPKPRGDFKPKVPVDESHGLWGFFPAPGKILLTPAETEGHGRAWTVDELRRKSWEDLHALWWVCCKERNMIATSNAELARSKIGFGEREFQARDEEVMKTMRAIKHTLTERYYTWQDAVELAEADPEIDLEAKDGQVYKPMVYEEPETADGWMEPEPPKEGESSTGETAKLQR